MQYLRDHDLDTVWQTFQACAADQQQLQAEAAVEWGQPSEDAGQGQEQDSSDEVSAALPVPCGCGRRVPAPTLCARGTCGQLCSRPTRCAQDGEEEEESGSQSEREGSDGDGEQQAAAGGSGQLNAAGRPQRASALHRKLPQDAPESSSRIPSAPKRRRKQQMPPREPAVATADAAAREEDEGQATPRQEGGGARRTKVRSRPSGTVAAGATCLLRIISSGCPPALPLT